MHTMRVSCNNIFVLILIFRIVKNINSNVKKNVVCTYNLFLQKYYRIEIEDKRSYTSRIIIYCGSHSLTYCCDFRTAASQQ